MIREIVKQLTATSAFAHINLNEVDPQGMSPKEGEILQFIVTKAVETQWSSEKGSGDCIDMTFTVTNSENFSGRNFYRRFFPDKQDDPKSKNATGRQLRILRDATGVGQTETVTELCEALVSQRAEFLAPVKKGKDREGYPGKMEVNLWDAKPIG